MEKKKEAGDSSNTEPSSFKLLASFPSGLSPSQVSVAFSDAYDRIPHSDITLENTIPEIWDQRSLNNKSLFNGNKFRYGGHVLHTGGESGSEPHVCLHLGLTDYRTFVGTNLSPLWERFLVSSEDDSVLCQHTSSPLGNGAVVETIDSKILVLQRSNNVGEFPGYFVFPGGHPEPQEVGITSRQYAKELTESINIKVSQEMFDSIVREVVEEIGVPASSLSIPAFIGISRRDLNVRPTAFFFIKCNLDSKEVQQFYSSALDGYESTKLYTVPMIELENMASRMPGCHRGGFALYKLMVDTRKIT
ncbi:putative NUDIX hydrolase domain-containing protein [Medicago truncatula]|uniref:Putative NUDIX hydrolase domain-containing protein n=1 Tax=Medicago truncatula TaxID=3880 RepID=A0A396I820_MEDTR|nr:nudix hydrolase 9 [Medicago truncatula]RHN60873.1 putative NUDIX hydrolase domain-containing protein [Medicago truncatula]